VTITDEIIALFAARGGGAYYGEPVTLLEHGLQAAHFARAAGAPAPLVAAALLHDIGHLLAAAPEDIADWHADARHEDVGAHWLAQHFGPAVSEPVRLHVAAKRYLCATVPAYLTKLSPASVHTLRLQGGPMDAAQQRAFGDEPHHREALQLRAWDEASKVPALATAGLDHYRELFESLAHRRA